ncbi:MAG: protoporphyrinogen oxidase [Candidatus Schekmanbacteria bacterium]|nr:protoporphyrinogen oxidase [Candidatus Schekmanbacteria bacterium]
MRKMVVIIGGGIAGLTVAYDLLRRKLDVLLLETEERVGGVMGSDRQEGFLVERGPNSFLSAPEIDGLIGELGLDEERVTAPATAPRYVYRGKQMLAVPMSPPALVKTSLLSRRAKARLFLEPFIAPNRDDDESVASFFTRRLGIEIAERLVDPFVSGVYAGDAARLSVRSSFPAVAALERDHGSLFMGAMRSRKKTSAPRTKRTLTSFRRGLGTLPAALQERLGDRIRCGVTAAIAPRAPGEGGDAFTVTVRHANCEGSTATLDARAVVIAAPALATAGLVAPFSGAAADQLRGVDYPPLVSMTLGFDAGAVHGPLDGFGFLIPRTENMEILGCIWSSSLFPERAPAGSVCLTAFIGGATNRGVARREQAELLQVVMHELRAAMGIAQPPTHVAIHKYERAIPQYNVGHEQRLGIVRESLAAWPGLFLAGSYLGGVSVADRVKTARETAARVAAFVAA